MVILCAVLFILSIYASTAWLALKYLPEIFVGFPPIDFLNPEYEHLKPDYEYYVK